MPSGVGLYGLGAEDRDSTMPLFDKNPSAITPKNLTLLALVSSSSGLVWRGQLMRRATIVGSRTEAHPVMRRMASARTAMSDARSLTGVGPPPGAVERPQGVPRLQELREDQHTQLGMGAPDLVRGDQPFVGIGGRHLDVDDGDVRSFQSDDPDELVAIVHLRDDLEPCVFEEVGRPCLISMASSAITSGKRISAGIVIAPAGTCSISRAIQAPTRSLRLTILVSSARS